MMPVKYRVVFLLCFFAIKFEDSYANYVNNDQRVNPEPNYAYMLLTCSSTGFARKRRGRRGCCGANEDAGGGQAVL